MRRMARWLRLGALSSLCAVTGVARRAEKRPAAPAYTIAFKSFAPNNTDIFIADGDGQHARPLVPDTALDYNASFSSDGRWIVFTSHRSGAAKIYRVHPDGSGLERLTDGPAFDDQGVLSPDGRTLAFVSTRGGAANIWLLDLGTRRQTCLTKGSTGDFRPAWSPDGEWIAFSSDRDAIRTAVNFATVVGTSVYVMRKTGSDVHRLTPTDVSAGNPSWSWDGSRVVYYRTAVSGIALAIVATSRFALARP